MRIIKRKSYYYIQHSYRKGNKVITLERYLGKTIPEDIEGIKQEILQKEKKEVYNKLGKIKISFQEEWRKIPDSVKEKELEEITIAFTYNTNAIEGSTITLEETREIIEDKIAPNKPLRDIKETEYHANAFLSMLEKRERVFNKLILNWHKQIFGETKQDIAGKYRDYLVRVGNHRAPDWHGVIKLMNQLINFINKSKINPVELAAISHYRFEKIHPFGDGNGRIGRLLMNQILWHKQYPMLIIEYKKRKSYYKALNRDEQGFINYFMRRYLSIHKNRLKI